MTPFENLTKMMKHNGPEWIPLDMPATPPVAERILKETGASSVEEAFDTDLRQLHPAWPDRKASWEKAFRARGVELPEDFVIHYDGTAWERPDPASLGEAWHLMRMINALRDVTSVEDLESLPWMDLNDPAPFEHLAGGVESIHEGGYVAVGFLEMTIFETAWYQRSMDQLFADLFDGDPVGDWLLDWATERSITVARAYCRAGCDLIRLGDDIGAQNGMLMSMDLWRRHLKPRLQKVVQAIREERGDGVWISYHSDGDIREAIPELIETGVDILNPIQPECMPVKDVVAQYKDRVAFWGMIGTQSTMPFGTVNDVRHAVEEVAAFARQGASVIVAPTHVLEPDVSMDNIRVLVDTARSIRL